VSYHSSNDFDEHRSSDRIYTAGLSALTAITASVEAVAVLSRV
jgi:hypothetical protein